MTKLTIAVTSATCGVLVAFMVAMAINPGLKGNQIIGNMSLVMSVASLALGILWLISQRKARKQ